MADLSKLASRIKNIFLILGLLICSLILLVTLPLTLLWAVVNGPTTFFPQKVFSQKSPDGKFEIDVFRKVQFPVLDIDPEITVYISLKNSEKNYEINSVKFDLREISDLEEPEITWTPNGAHIENIDTHKQFAFDLGLPDYLRQY